MLAIKTCAATVDYDGNFTTHFSSDGLTHCRFFGEVAESLIRVLDQKGHFFDGNVFSLLIGGLKSFGEPRYTSNGNAFSNFLDLDFQGADDFVGML
ncbi:hypothetical protein N7539_004671 [Penicillium diatomitis]|uniref:Uncharacterized protein n=1 Tax=Penicillium diatomitis TaxID=2819901 RepID=A0A9W9XEJ2_9EURO|nr:uncharacterized protein N7539_004671 [Penicillium diatomitis]KAJ5489781.1 hypothetical protein N7539_004671 [Penicillium diatomitis]